MMPAWNSRSDLVRVVGDRSAPAPHGGQLELYADELRAIRVGRGDRIGVGDPGLVWLGRMHDTRVQLG
jgi:hypothetical protein